MAQLFSSLSSAEHSASVPCPLNLIAFLTLCPPDADLCDPPPIPQSGQIEMLIQISTCFTSATTNDSDPMSENCLVNQQKGTKIQQQEQLDYLEDVTEINQSNRLLVLSALLRTIHLYH